MVARPPRPVLAELRRHRPGARALAWAETADGYAVALPGHLAWGRGRIPLDWRLIGWHDIVRGGWDPDAGRLRWCDGAGGSEQVDLIRPGRLPLVFQDRVEATFALERRLGQGPEEIVLSAQRRLDDDQAALIWRITPLDPATLPPARLAEAERLLEKLRQSYD
ncbi:MAG: hypothetical protein LBL55_03625 [Propionibacteriaceae bacterium]|jgi:hypothetical protein|nr:hypothetical protein [Propionibacteriaceae bacterium]